MERASQHTFQVLTKRPKRMRNIVSDPDWKAGRAPGRTPAAERVARHEHRERRLRARADYLRETPAAVRFISAEPLLGPLPSLDLTGIDWLIVGGESGPNARPMEAEWVRDLQDAAARRPARRSSSSSGAGARRSPAGASSTAGRGTRCRQWLSASVSGMMAEYYKRAGEERTREAIQRAITRGVPPWPRVTPGYLKRPDGYAPDPRTAAVIREAFEMRARGALVREVREHLAANGVRLTYAGVAKLLKSHTVLGEIRFGKFTPNLAAHEPIVDRATWEAVQRTRVLAGRHSKSERLLARLGILRCGTCDSRMVTTIVIGARSAGGGGGKSYPIYRCQNPDCARRVTISAPMIESIVVGRVQAEFADVEGRASVAVNARDAEVALEVAQRELDAAIRVLDVVGDESSAVARLAQLREARDAARGEVDRLGGLEAAHAVNVADDWDRLTLAERRAAIRVTVARVTIGPGRGIGRVRVDVFG
jgi:hypothetical protein